VDNGETVLAEGVAAYQAAFGARLVAAYALGSLAHGGFSPLVSDVDLGLVLADPPAPSDPDRIAAVADTVKAGGSPLHQRLSVFWATPGILRGEVAGGRFPPLDRLDLLENGRLLAGADVRPGLGPAAAPGGEELLVAGADFAVDFLGPGHEAEADGPASGTISVLGSLAPVGGAVLHELHHPDELLAQGVRHATKIVLFPARFLYTAATGRVGTNEAAVAHYLAQPGGPARELVGAAYRWRTQPPDDSVAATELLRRELLPLYRQYVDDHLARLTELKEEALAEAFGRWRRHLEEP
jgi:hypothetical protein